MNPERFKCLLLQINADQMLVEELGPIMERWVARDPDAKAQAGEFDDDLAAASILQESRRASAHWSGWSATTQLDF